MRPSFLEAVASQFQIEQAMVVMVEHVLLAKPSKYESAATRLPSRLRCSLRSRLSPLTSLRSSSLARTFTDLRSVHVTRATTL